MLIQLQCPNCGATMSVDDSKEFIFCESCGTKVMNAAQKVEITQTIINKTDKSNDPNLFISYHSTDNSVQMVTRLCYSNRKDVYMSGQELSYHLPKGKHDIVLKIGKINYDRTIYVPEDNTPVRINASWSGRAHIAIDQPTYTAPSGELTQEVPVSNKPSRGTTRLIVWGAIAIVLGLIFLISDGEAWPLVLIIPGILMLAGGIVKKVLTKKKEEDKKQ